MLTSRAAFVVTDTETTGGSAGRDRIIEIGAAKVVDGEVVDRFQQLINPERSISRRITQLTGITTAMVYDKPTIDEVLPDYLAFLGDDVFVAHNAPFDTRFLNAELQRNGFDALAQPVLCTLRLARRLLPGLRSKGLSALIGFYQISMQNRHRALGDADATAEILGRFLSQLRFEYDVSTIDELLSFQRKRYRDVRKVPSHVQRIRQEILPDVPELPGVYTFTASNGEVIYIGKAANLRHRVRSYFCSMESHEARRQKLMKRVRSVSWEETPSELDAILLESHQIKKHRPRYNRAQLWYRRRPFLKIAINQTYPSVTWTYDLRDAEAEYYGPMRSREEAKWVIEIIQQFFRMRDCDDDELQKGESCYLADIERCTAPCVTTNGNGEYASAVEEVRAFLMGEGAAVLDQLDESMRKAAGEMNFERAAELRDKKERVAKFVKRRACVGAAAYGHHALYVQESASEVRLFLISAGRHVETLVLRRPVAGHRKQIQAAIERHHPPEKTPDKSLSQREAHEMKLLEQWLYRHRGELEKIVLNGAGADQVVDRVMGAACIPHSSA